MNESIGNRISKYRKMKNLTQEALANLMGVSSQAVSKWETDASCPDIAALPQLCKILGITADELLTGNSNEVKLVTPAERKPMEELVLRVKVLSAAGDKVRVNLPMSLVKLAMEIGVDVVPNVGATMPSCSNPSIWKRWSKWWSRVLLVNWWRSKALTAIS